VFQLHVAAAGQRFRIKVLSAERANERLPRRMMCCREQAPGRGSKTLTFRTAQGHELGPLHVETAVVLLRAPS
jgi:hypothetical protein